MPFAQEHGLFRLEQIRGVSLLGIGILRFRHLRCARNQAVSGRVKQVLVIDIGAFFGQAAFIAMQFDKAVAPPCQKPVPGFRFP